jgi:hypothetical protein
MKFQPFLRNVNLLDQPNPEILLTTALTNTAPVQPVIKNVNVDNLDTDGTYTITTNLCTNNLKQKRYFLVVMMMKTLKIMLVKMTAV